ncbi:SRPBCC domain-containing protein [bacterium]|nr:SRPBCC domain-containing protein [bacterium]
MSISDNTPNSQTETLVFVVELKHPPEKVWRALTDPTLLAQWLLPVFDFQTVPGQQFTFKTEPKPGWDGIVHCRLLESEPCEKISYTWTVGEMDTCVTFTLTATEGGTKMTLMHSGFKPDQKANFGGARYGWKMMLGRLVDLVV